MRNIPSNRVDQNHAGDCDTLEQCDFWRPPLCTAIRLHNGSAFRLLNRLELRPTRMDHASYAVSLANEHGTWHE